MGRANTIGAGSWVHSSDSSEGALVASSGGGMPAEPVGWFVERSRLLASVVELTRQCDSLQMELQQTRAASVSAEGGVARVLSRFLVLV